MTNFPRKAYLLPNPSHILAITNRVTEGFVFNLPFTRLAWSCTWTIKKREFEVHNSVVRSCLLQCLSLNWQFNLQWRCTSSNFVYCICIPPFQKSRIKLKAPCNIKITEYKKYKSLQSLTPLFDNCCASRRLGPGGSWLMAGPQSLTRCYAILFIWPAFPESHFLSLFKLF